MPLEGNQFSFSEKASTSSSASQNVGADTPIRAITMQRPSRKLFCFTPAMMPKGTPMTTESSHVAKPSPSVRGMRRNISSEMLTEVM